ncbi:MAG: cyclic nucleotide-binding domain-containing protein [Actinomycetota bacterium]
MADKRQDTATVDHSPSTIADRAELGRALMPTINDIVRKLGVGQDEPAYSTIAELAEDLRSVTEQIRAARQSDSRVLLRTGGSRRTYLPGEAIFKEGEHPGEEAYIIEEGTIQILKLAPEGHEIYLDVSRPGDIVGEMALVDSQPRMATARVTERCTAAVITGTQFRTMLDKADPISRRLINVLVRRLRYQSSEITRLKSLLGINE